MKRRRFGYLKAAPKRRRFAVVLSKTTSFWYRQNFKKKKIAEPKQRSFGSKNDKTTPF